MKLEELLRLRKTIGAHSDEAISAALAYKMVKFLKQSDSEDAFYVSKLKGILAKYEDTSQNSKNGEIHIQKDKVKECNEEIMELMATDVDVPSVKFSLHELEELKLSVSEMYSLDKFVIEEE